MKIKNINLYLENFKPKAKKIVRAVPAIAMAASMILTPMTAYAAVPNNEILGDAQVAEDRSYIKAQDGIEIADYFDGYDNYGCAIVTLEDIEKAIQMSDILNATMGDELDDINTTRNEVLGLDIYGLYNEYQHNSNRFARRHQDDRSAIDAYLTFSTHTVTTHVKDQLANIIASLIKVQGQNLTVYPYVTINSNEVSCVVGINGVTKKIVLHGDKIDELRNQCNSLEYHYNMALCSINGSSPYYEDTFAYNGVRSTTGESVWLSMGNQGLKDELRTAIASARELDTREALEFTTPDPFAYRYMPYEEALNLQQKGYYIPDLYHVEIQDVYVNPAPRMDFNK